MWNLSSCLVVCLSNPFIYLRSLLKIFPERAIYNIYLAQFLSWMLGLISSYGIGWPNVKYLFNPNLIEHQLTCVPQNRIRSAYNRTQYWDERVKMMEWYGEWVKEWIVDWKMIESHAFEHGFFYLKERKV